MATVTELKFAIQQITIYLGLFIVISGMIGGLLNLILFTTLNVFRQTTSAFYLTFASVVGMGQLMTSLLVQILSGGFDLDPKTKSWFCKSYLFAANWYYTVVFTIICLATFDQFLSMSKYRHLSNKKLAYRSITITCLFWLAHHSLLFFYWDVGSSGVCTVINPTYAMYYTRFTIPVLSGCVPIGAMTTFASLAFHQARTSASRQLHIVRQSHDRQLTAMILTYVIYTVIVLTPFTAFYVYTVNVTARTIEESYLNALIYTIVILMAYSMFAAPFYIYCCVSTRFRQQLVDVFRRIFIHRCQQTVQHRNQVGLNQQMVTIVPRPRAKIPLVEVLSIA